jgi:hypothetical protein
MFHSHRVRAAQMKFIEVAKSPVPGLCILTRTSLALLHPRNLLSGISVLKKMSPLSLFHGRSGDNIEACVGAVLARSWYMADGPPSHADLGVRFEWLTFLHSDHKKVRAAALYAAYQQCRSEIMDDQAALRALEERHYTQMCSEIPIHFLPEEILREIFCIALDIGEERGGLMLVCQRWCQIIERITSAWTSLNLGARTTPESVQKLLSRAGTHPLAVEIDLDKVEGMEERLYSSLAMAGNKASQWNTLTVCSLAQHELDTRSDHALISIQLQPMRQLRQLSIKAPVLSPLLRLLLQNAATKAVGTLMSMEIHSFPAVQYLLQPAHASIYCSLTTFIAKVPKMNQPVDLLPHFTQLEVLDLTNLLLPVFANSSPLPLAHTLHHLCLNAVSIQWMGGRVFSHLENCTIIAPLTGPSLHHDVQLPACNKLHFENWDISPNGQFFAPALDHLRVKSNTWSSYIGNVQVVRLVRAGFGMALQPKSLFLSVACKDTVLLAVIQLLPGLVELKLDLPRPSALGEKFFTGLLARPEGQLECKLKFRWSELFRKNTTGWRCTVCPSLRILELKYQQWLRPGYNYDFLPLLFALSWSRGKTATPLELLVYYKSSMHLWESFDPMFQAAGLRIVQHGRTAQLSLKTETWKSGVHDNALILFHLHVLEITSSSLTERRVLDVLPSFHELRELELSCVYVPPLTHDVDFPLVHTLRKLSLRDSTLDWMDGLVFTKLQRFMVDEHGWPKAFKRKVGMPACTHIVFEQGKLETLPILESNFHFPLLDTCELTFPWEQFRYDQGGIEALQRMRAKILKFSIVGGHESLLTLLRDKDEVEQLELVLLTGFSSSFLFPSAQDILDGMSVTTHTIRKAPCPNMKVLMLRLVDFGDADRGHISESCREMMDKRRLAGYPLEKCYVWLHKKDWKEAASLVLVMENEKVRVEE